MSNGLFVSIAEAAEMLQVNPETIRRRIKRGEIKAQLVKGPRGDQYQIPTSELTTQDAEIIPVQQLPPAVLAQLNESTAKAIQSVVGPLQAIIQAQQDAMRAQADEIKALREQLAAQAEKTDTAIDNVAKAIEAESKKSIFAKLFG